MCHFIENMSINKLWFESFSNSNNDSKLGAMAAEIAIQNFEFNYATLLFFSSTIYYGVDTFIKMFNNSIIISRGEINHKMAKMRQYVIFVGDITQLEGLLSIFQDLEMDNTGKFIIICQSQNLSDCDENKMTRILWHYKIVDVVIIKSEGEETLGYTYFPISDGSCNNNKPIKVEKLNNSQYYSTQSGDIFGMKLKRLSFCSLIVSTFINPPYMNITDGKPTGADGDLLPLLAYGLNTSLEMMTPHHGDGWGFRQDNGTWVGSLADIDEDLANISMTSAALTLTRFSDFQLSSSYYVSHVVWVTHPAAYENEALKLLHPFETSTRIALVLSFVFVIMCALVIRILSYLHSSNTEFSMNIIFDSWLICMGQALLKMPTKSAVLNITVLWIYYCFLIRTAYQVYLISSLKGTYYVDQFQSIDDAIQAKYPFGGGAALRDYYIEYPAVYDNWIPVDAPEMKHKIIDISKGQKFVMAMNSDSAKLLIKQRKIGLHILPQKIVTTPSVIFFKKYSPLAESINIVLSRIVTSGLPEKLHEVYTTVKTKTKDTNEEEPLQLIHFAACYLVLTTGWILSLVLFSLEIYLGKINKQSMFSNMF